jgi:hypothetical protein
MGRIAANRVTNYMIWLTEFKKSSKEHQNKRDERKLEREDRKQNDSKNAVSGS